MNFNLLFTKGLSVLLSNSTSLFLPVLLSHVLWVSCINPYPNDDYRKYKYDQVTFPDTPTNMRAINSEYDDYNSNYEPPNIESVGILCFSSNRNSSGKHFDIIETVLNVSMSKKTGILTLTNSSSSNSSSNYYYYPNNQAPSENMARNALKAVNTTSDEFGPYFIYQEPTFNNDDTLSYYIFLYANSYNSNNLDIKFTHNYTGVEKFASPKPIVFVNSDKDDLYPTLNKNKNKIFFCSNREGNFDIFSTNLNLPSWGKLLANISDTTPRTITKESVLSSAYDDKCPMILGNLLVFTSNRPGGYGGFDLYYSIYKNDQWSEPVNFGPKINSDKDEYRPFLGQIPSATYGSDYPYKNDFMIFSSNRSGGLGGFDLYYVGIPKMTGL